MKKIVLPKEYSYVSAFLTMRCNLSCSFCLNAFDKDFDRKGFEEISGEQWIDALNRLELGPGVPVTFCGGEPFLHKDFIPIINGIKPELDIDILTNLQWGKKGIERFAENVRPERVKRNSPYASIRVSYHPEQMGDGKKLVEDVKFLKDRGYSIGIWSVMYPSSEQLAAINQMQFRCLDAGVEFRLKEFTGRFKEDDYGDYTRYPGSTFQSDEHLRACVCKTSELLMGPNGDVYRCHRDLFAAELPVGNVGDPNFDIDTRYRSCNKYGQCHPCDVKLKTNHKQQLGHTSVDIQGVK